MVAFYTYGYFFDSYSGFQAGTAMLLAALLYFPLLIVKRENRPSALKKAKRLTAGTVVFVTVFLVGGEIALRVFYLEGYSFGSHYGPIVKRFERDFRYNHYDGPSRGPEISEETNPGTLRILVQGDSITWGQGVRNEEQLFSTLLLDEIKSSGRPAEMAVLARPGREVDDHLEQLQKWSEQIDPGVIIYQWYVNDIELDKSSRPAGTARPWRILYVHRILSTSSYLYYFLDYQFGRMLPSSAQNYEEYIGENYAQGTIAWTEFERAFRAWAKVAKSTTPRVLVAIYPHMKFPVGQRPTLNPLILDIHDRFMALCRSENLQVLDLYDALSMQANSRDLVASEFDGHPGTVAHQIIATALDASLRKSWPEIFSPDVITP